ncbi:hypothetical protein LCGC14_1548660 [marine sediment metagenome]|uniref:Terminase large subunit gp17-like C-terminal domain-containing protein n=1 Tax=marine sediment metagenome TaxID=412755 RepID=A0A0F9IR03_9ZZZZ
MIQAITEQEIDFIEDFYDPIAYAECMFSDFDNLSTMNEKFGHIRNGQVSMLSYEYTITDNPELTKKQNFHLKEGAGSIYNLGARKYGKTLITLLIDMLTSVPLLAGWETIFSSFDHVHVRKVLETFIAAIENHPFLRTFKPKVKRSPAYFILFKNGFLIQSVNQNVASKNPGGQFFGHHTKKHWMEEASKETDKVEEKRVDAISELGCIERFSGMTDFTKYSPAGKIFYNAKKRNWIANFPQYISPMWDEKTKKDSVKKYGGEDSIGYRIFIKGEIVEDGISVFDMERVRRNYDEDRDVKHIELTKERFKFFRDILLVERPKNAEVMYMAADIGESAPSEIILISKVNEIYKYLYNITLYNLTDKEQFQIFKYIAELIKVNFIGLDTTEGTGRAIFRSLEDHYTRDHLVWCAFNEKIPIDFERDDRDNIIYKDGKPVHREEFVAEWSMQHLKNDLLYMEKMYLPMDYKLDVQLNSVISMQSGNRTVYACKSDEDHLLSAFRVFSIMHWYNEFNLIKPIIKKNFGKTGV